MMTVRNDGYDEYVDCVLSDAYDVCNDRVMTWNSGPMLYPYNPPPGVEEHLDDETAEVLEARHDAAAADAALFAAIAETDPGITRTLGMLIGELAVHEMPPDVARRLGEHLQRIGETVARRAGRVTIDG